MDINLEYIYRIALSLRQDVSKYSGNKLDSDRIFIDYIEYSMDETMKKTVGNAIVNMRNLPKIYFK